MRERLTSPYLRFDFPDGTSRTFRLYDGMRTLLDSHMADVPNWSDAHEKPDPWPAEGLRLWRGFRFDADYTVAAGYECAIANPWRFAGNGPYEQIRAKDGSLVYEGEALRAAQVRLEAERGGSVITAAELFRALERRDCALLCALLSGEFRLCHFEDQLVEGIMRFDYRLREGPAVSRNAIRLLRLMGFDEALADRADARAARYLASGRWER